ncbi:protein-export chaperone SecB [Clostridium sp. Marseille-P2415]|uniref:protein-export chaperone SecB n=1 Tax=Clostridium sp. Marseille-P2415 TaxID=1805471 RepID=UPI0009888118|nr:protein-export chaperone SecB [Clostridium sp. Marseille-P2415]
MKNIISPFQMKRNHVVNFNFEQIDNIIEYDSTNVKIGVDFNISNISESNKQLEARIDLMILLTGVTDSNEKLFDINLDMMGIFEANKDEIDEKKFNNMLRVNGISTLMQLSRAYVTAATALSGFVEPINFPMINVFELIRMKEESESKEAGVVK